MSPYAAKGFEYEVRLPIVHPKRGETGPVLDQIKTMVGCRIVGRSVRFHARIPQSTVRLYLRSEAELFAVRLILDDVFRVYRLRSAS